MHFMKVCRSSEAVLLKGLFGDVGSKLVTKKGKVQVL